MLQPPYGAEKELKEIYRHVFAVDEIDKDQFSRVRQAMNDFIRVVTGTQVQYNVFNALFAILAHAMNKTTTWDAEVVRAVKDALDWISQNVQNPLWRVDEKTIRFRWRGNESYIEFNFPELDPAPRAAT